MAKTRQLSSKQRRTAERARIEAGAVDAARRRRLDELEHAGTIKPDKASMEEALRVTCHECGYSGGRHSGFCSRSR